MSEEIDITAYYRKNVSVPDYTMLLKHIAEELSVIWREYGLDYESEAMAPLEHMAYQSKGFPPGSGKKSDEVAAFDFSFSPVSLRTLTVGFSDQNTLEQDPPMSVSFAVSEYICFETGRDFSGHYTQPNVGADEYVWPMNRIYIWRLLRAIMTAVPITLIEGDEWYFPSSWSGKYTVTSIKRVDRLIQGEHV